MNVEFNNPFILVYTLDIHFEEGLFDTIKACSALTDSVALTIKVRLNKAVKK
jgi:hypothetical protein